MYQSYSWSYVSYLLYECHSYFIFKSFLIFSGLVKLLLISTPSLLIQMFYSAFLILQIIPMIINQPILFIIAFNWNRCKLLSPANLLTHLSLTPCQSTLQSTSIILLSIDITHLLSCSLLISHSCFPQDYTQIKL